MGKIKVYTYIKSKKSTLYPLFKIPISASGRKYYVIYCKSTTHTEALFYPSHVLIVDENGWYKLSSTGDFWEIPFHLSTWNRFSQSVASDDSLIKNERRYVVKLVDFISKVLYIYIGIKDFKSNVNRMYNIPKETLDAIPTYLVTNNYFKKYTKNKLFSLPLELNVSYLHNLLRSTESETERKIIQMYYKKVVTLHRSVSFLNEKQIDMIDKLRFSQLVKELKVKPQWNADYAYSIAKRILLSYRQANGHALFIFNLMEDPSKAKEDESILFLLTNVLHVTMNEELENSIEKIYNEAGIDYKGELSAFTKSRIAYARSKKLPFYAVQYKYSYVRILNRNDVRIKGNKTFFYDYDFMKYSKILLFYAVSKGKKWLTPDYNTQLFFYNNTQKGVLQR